MMGFYWFLLLIMYHTAACDGRLALCLCMSVCLCVFAITTPRRSHTKANFSEPSGSENRTRVDCIFIICDIIFLD